jgi:hypothetical protein
MPVGSSSLTIPIALGVAIPLGLAIIVLLYLHHRSVKKVKQEDATDPHKSLDFGFGEGGNLPKKSGKGKSMPGQEKPGNRHRQMSMDLNLSSPYLLPPALQSSRESLHSLARTLHQNEDPYRPVAQYAGSDAGSIRSARLGKDGASVFTKTSGDRDLSVRGRSPLPQHVTSPSSPPQPPGAVHRKPAPLQTGSSRTSLPGPLPTLDRAPSDPFLTPVDSTPPRSESPPFPPHAIMPDVPEVGLSDPLSTRDLASGIAGSPRVTRRAKSPPPLPPAAEVAQPENHWDRDQPVTQFQSSDALVAGLGLMNVPADQQHDFGLPELNFFDHDADTRQPQLPAVAVEEPHGSYDFGFDAEPQNGNIGAAGYDGRGRRPERGDSIMYQPDSQFHGLAVPERDAKRLSVGFRPLPPDEVMETDDPEIRANRIRSFYKEYFEDPRERGGQPPPMPTSHAFHQQQQHQQGQPQHYQEGQYYEDYDSNYVGPEATYFDPDSNAFVTPYSQPIARRAMTPPPSGSRFAGGPRPPRGPHHGSMGGGSLRPGSSASNQPRFRTGSAMSNRSGRSGAPRRPGPPPAPLNTLPTPSKLRDDSFALFNAADFAPPETYAERVRGRSQSPMGERRAYQPKVPVHSPLVNAFDELAALPSP